MAGLFSCFKKIKHAKFSEKLAFLTPWCAHVRVCFRGKKCWFFGEFDVFYFLETTKKPYHRWLSSHISDITKWHEKIGTQVFFHCKCLLVSNRMWTLSVFLVRRFESDYFKLLYFPASVVLKNLNIVLSFHASLMLSLECEGQH